MKSFTIVAFFAEVKPAHEAYQTATVAAGDFTVAATRALHEIRSRPGIAGKRIREVRLTIKESAIVSSPPQ
jgi:hypothetical protein